MLLNKSRIITATALLAVTAIASIHPASAQEKMCAERDVFLDQLSVRYGELPERFGLMPNGNVLEVFSSDGGSFTVLVTNPKGQSCMIASGDAWMPSDKKLHNPVTY